MGELRRGITAGACICVLPTKKARVGFLPVPKTDHNIATCTTVTEKGAYVGFVIAREEDPSS